MTKLTTISFNPHFTETNQATTGVSNNLIFYNAGTSITNGIALTIGANVEVIPDYMFCPSADANTGVTNATGSPKIKTLTFIEGCHIVGDYAFMYCDEIVAIDLPNSLTNHVSPSSGNPLSKHAIGHYAFYGCSAATLLKIEATSNNVTIGNYAFYGCSSLPEIILPDNVKDVNGKDGSNATINVPGIGVSAFEGCSKVV